MIRLILSSSSFILFHSLVHSDDTRFFPSFFERWEVGWGGEWTRRKDREERLDCGWNGGKAAKNWAIPTKLRMKRGGWSSLSLSLCSFFFLSSFFSFGKKREEKCGWHALSSSQDTLDDPGDKDEESAVLRDEEIREKDRRKRGKENIERKERKNEGGRRERRIVACSSHL